MSRPNIIFYFTDQQRWDTMGCYGQRLEVTPNLDKMAKEGTRFDLAFTCQPVCGPARACLQTGIYATEVGVHTNGRALKSSDTLARRFNDAGYDTAYIGKWHLASDNATGGESYRTTAVPKERRGGYRHWMAADALEFTSHGYNGTMFDGDMQPHHFVGYRVDCLNAFAIDYIHQWSDNGREKPFFLFLSHLDPHHQNDRDRYEGPDGSKHKFADYDVPGDLEGTQGDWRENYPDYLGSCNSIDDNVGKLMDTLKAYGIDDNTVIIYTSDHGSHFKTRNEEYKRSCHDSCLRIPMLAWGPGFMGGNVVDELVSLIDVPATLLDCAGMDIPQHYRGGSMKKLVSGQEKDWPQSVFAQLSEAQTGRTVRTKDWKYAVKAPEHLIQNPGSDVYEEAFLYDLKNDPHERNNLIAQAELEKVRAELRELLLAYVDEVEGESPQILPAKAQ
ncbi:MAG: sulfatase-like hydrolase/transferase [Christensenellales bacterium]|jgi:arylsulfatase A-like enzyme